MNQDIGPTLSDRVLRASTEVLLQRHAAGGNAAELRLELTALVESTGAAVLPSLLAGLVERLILADAALADMHLPMNEDGGERLLRVVAAAARDAGTGGGLVRQLEPMLAVDASGRSAWRRLLRGAAGAPDPASVAMLPAEFDLGAAAVGHLEARPAAPASGQTDDLGVGPWVLPPARARIGSLHGLPQAVLGQSAGRVGDRYVLSLRSERDLAELHAVVLREVEGVSDLVFPTPGARWAPLDRFREKLGLYRIPLRLRPPEGRHRYIVILVPSDDVPDQAFPPRLSGLRRGVEEGRFGVEDFVVDVVDPHGAPVRRRREVRNAAVIGMARNEHGDWVSSLAVPGRPVHRSPVRSVEHPVTRASALLEVLTVKLEAWVKTRRGSGFGLDREIPG